MTKPVGYPQEPKALWDNFYKLSQVPRPSKKEEKCIRFLEERANDFGLEYKKDSAGNVIIYVPATQGRESEASVILQSHMDMVCDKLPEKTFDFENDPIELKVVDGRVMASGTTLGADNGYGCAVMLGLAEVRNTISHPALELLFTTDEETGLHGAKNLDHTLLSGKKMINLDTEEWGAIYIGCAGGIDYEFNGGFEQVSSSRKNSYEINLSGLCGGHSGLNIHEGRGNAIKLLSEALTALFENEAFDLTSFSGGTAHNIIPRDAKAVIQTNASKEEIERILETKRAEFKSFLHSYDHCFELSCSSTEQPAKTLKDTENFLSFLNLYPHGAKAYNWDSEEPLVTYSSNMAIVRLKEGSLYSQTSLRFTNKKEAQTLIDSLKYLAKSFSLDLVEGVGYPSWQPDFTSSFVKSTKELIKKHFSLDAKVKAIHAGLECGLLKEKLGDLEIISLGPDISGAHSPTESLEIESSNSVWNLVLNILEEL